MTQGGKEREGDLKILCCYYRMGSTGERGMAGRLGEEL